MNKDTLFFRGSGRGRKPEWAELSMRNFIEEVQKKNFRKNNRRNKSIELLFKGEA